MSTSPTYHFPRGFLWGAATAAHQVEGHNTNNNWAVWEEQPGRIHNGDRSGAACGWWDGRWKEDFDRAAENGQNAHRLSIEWSRIQPEPERWDEDALDHYRTILRGAVERGLMPMLTLHHFSEPRWIYEQGGWENDATPAAFERFVRKVVEALKEYVTYWITINEPNVYAVEAYLDGAFPPGKKGDTAATFCVLRNLMRGHVLAYRTIHQIQPEARVGIAHHYRSMQPARSNFLPDIWLARLMSSTFNRAFANTLLSGQFRFLNHREKMPEAVGTQDFVGVNYYTRDLVQFVLDPSKRFAHTFYPPGAALSGTGFLANVPEGMAEALRWAKQFNLPMVVTENGVEDATDQLRPRYLAEHLHQVWHAVNFNWPIKGYFHWSLVDNFEWERGWSQRFGLWGLDVKTQARIRRPSVDFYAAICKENGLAYNTVAQYAPGALKTLFPD